MIDDKCAVQRNTFIQQGATLRNPLAVELQLMAATRKPLPAGKFWSQAEKFCVSLQRKFISEMTAMTTPLR